MSSRDETRPSVSALLPGLVFGEKKVGTEGFGTRVRTTFEQCKSRTRFPSITNWEKWDAMKRLALLA